MKNVKKYTNQKLSLDYELFKLDDHITSQHKLFSNQNQNLDQGP